MRDVDEQIAAWGGESTVEREEMKAGNPFWKRIFWCLDECSRFSERATRGSEQRPLRIVLIDDERFNARATVCSTNEGAHFVDIVAINTGMIYTMLDVFSRLLGHPDVLITVPGSQDEVADRVAVEKLYAAPFSNGTPILPLSSQRLSVAVSLVTIGLDFIVHHELIHLVNGHIDFRRVNSGMPAIDESKQLTAANVDVTTYTLEFDADSCAVGVSLQRGISIVKKLSTAASDNQIFKDTGVMTIYASVDAYVYHFAFVIYVFFKLFYQGPENIFSSRTHPAPQVRLWWVLCTIASIQVKKNIALGEKAHESATHGALEAERAIASVTGRTPDYEMIRNGMDQGSPDTELLRGIRAEWQRLRPLLDPFSRGGKLAPAIPD